MYFSQLFWERSPCFLFTLTILVRVSTDKCGPVSPSVRQPGTDHVHGAVVPLPEKRDKVLQPTHRWTHLNSRGTGHVWAPCSAPKEEDKWLEFERHRIWTVIWHKSQVTVSRKEEAVLDSGLNRTLPLYTHLICNQFHKDHLYLLVHFTQQSWSTQWLSPNAIVSGVRKMAPHWWLMPLATYLLRNPALSA